MNDDEQEKPGSPPAPVGDRAASGFFWLTLQKWLTRVLSFVTIVILTRFLRPEDFGLVAAAASMLPFFYLFADLGFSAYIVQADKADERTTSTGFWFSAVAGIVLCAAFVALAPLAVTVFRSDQVVPILQVMSLCVILTALSSVPTALLRRQMRFRALAMQGSMAALIAQITAIVMTLSGFGVWALVAQAMVSQLVTCIAVWVAAAWRPTFVFSRAEFVRMTRFGGQVLGVEFVGVARGWGEAAIVSATLGLAGFGYLNIAQRLVQIVQDLAGAAIVQVTTVAFARIREAPVRLRDAYLRALRTIYTVMAPPLTLIAVAAPAIIPVVFGDGWGTSQGPAQILALAGILTLGAQLDTSLFYGLGKPGKWFAYAVVVDALTITVTAITVQWGLDAVAVGFLIVALVATLARWVLVARLIGTRARVVAGPFGFLSVAVLASVAAGAGVTALTAQLPNYVAIALVGVVILAAHIAAIRVVAPSVIDELLVQIARFSWTRRIPLLPRPRSTDEQG